MANTYSKILLHFVIVVKFRRKKITESIKNELEPYICEIVKSEKCLVFAIYCNADHTHILIRMSPDKSPSDLMRKVKSESTNFVNRKFHSSGEFCWQGGYAAFSLRQEESQIVVNYILNQKEHHKQRAFKDEYKDFLKENEISYKEKYLFEFED